MPKDKMESIDLDALAVRLVGDGKKPNIFFVSREGDVLTVTQDYAVALSHWETLANNMDGVVTLEDRLSGVLASVEPETDEPGAKLVRYDVDPRYAPAETNSKI